jgi:SpoIID/LytB domain protein
MTVSRVRPISLLAALAVAVGSALIFAAPALAERTVIIEGGGFGHGIGMSQYGAYGRALKGQSSTQILKHYYTGIDVSTNDMPSIRVGLLQGQSGISFTSSALSDGGGQIALKVKGSPGKLARGGSGTAWKVEPSSTGGYRVYKNSKQIERDGDGVFGSPTEPLIVLYEKKHSLVKVSLKSYGLALGHLEVGTYSSSSCSGGYCARVVASLSMQKYLYGLGEVPSSWPQQALQAQAIAGRTYAYQKATASGQHRVGCDCAVYDSTYDQAYIGDAKRTGSGEYWDDWTNAVDATKGQVGMYGGNPIQALYSSSSGGFTENNENVWGGSPVPYLRGVKDKPDYAQGHNPNFEWTIKMSYSAFQSRVNSSFGVGKLKRFKLVKPFGVSGRVTVVDGDKGGVRIVGSEKTVRASGWSIRSALGLKDTLFRVDLGYAVAGKMAHKYHRLQGAPGAPKGPSYPVPKGSKHPKGRAQDFKHGRITWTKDGTVAWQSGRSLAAYDALGRERSALGMPTSDSWGTKSYQGASYQHGALYWSKATGAHSVSGDWLRAYRKRGGPAGALGLPLGKPSSSPKLPHGGRAQRFAHGTLYLDPSTKRLRALWGPIDARYRRLGQAGSACGYPDGMTKSSDARAEARFANGAMSWSSTGGIRVDCPAH